MLSRFRTVLAAAYLAVLPVTTAYGQTLITELDLTTGFATEDGVTAGAAQLRGFGEIKGLRFNLEGTWGNRSESVTDAFGAAYPYGGRIDVSEAYAERTFQPGQGLVGIRAGRFRSPFGISSRTDHAYSGFLRAPLIRYDGYWALTNGFREQGASIIVGTTQLSVEASVGTPGDLGVVRRRSGVDGVVRLQGYFQNLIVGVSHINSDPYAPAEWAHGRLNFTGVDARWAHRGVQLRGEWIAGQPWDGPDTNGGYVDALVHVPFMGPVTAVFRSEWLNYYSAFPFSWHDEDGYTEWHATRLTAGGRIRLPKGFTAQIDVMRQSEELAYHGRAGLDVALTYSIRR